MTPAVWACKGAPTRSAAATPEELKIPPIKQAAALVAVVTMAGLPVVATAHGHHHHRGCRTAKCDHHIDIVWGRRHHWHPKESAYHATASSALEACIIRKESGGNPQAVSGKYMGIGQWEESRWLSDGGGRYASTPLGASYSEQEAVLRGEGEAGMREQQGQYDGCS